MRTLLISATSALLLCAQVATAKVQMLDRIVATVDQDVVTEFELESRFKNIKTRSEAAGNRLPPDDILKKQILNQLIDETLQIGAARRYGIRVSDQEVLQAITAIMQRQGWDEATLNAELAKEGKSFAAFRTEMENQLLMQNISQGLVRSRIKISEQDIDNFLKSADAQFWISPDYHISHILIATSKASSPSEAEKKANTIYKKLLSGAKFGELAIAESDGPLALQGGDMGWRKSTELPTLFAQIAPDLKEGEVSKPAKSPAGYHILKLNAKRGETKQIVNQTKARHILLKTSAILNDEQAEAKLKDIRNQIINGTAFEVLAKEHSEDIASKLSGGDLGWASPGQFVPAFEQAMDNTVVGEITEPFRSRFGWHIIQVDERRAEDMTQDAIRMKARNVLMGRRFEDEVQLWIQEMRDNAFIEIKI